MIIHSDFMTYDEFLKVKAFDGKSGSCSESNSVKTTIQNTSSKVCDFLGPIVCIYKMIKKMSAWIKQIDFFW